MKNRPHSAIILAAGLATRMRPLTNKTAKPLLELGGRTLLDHAIAHLVAEAVTTIVINSFWQADKIIAHLERRRPPPKIITVREETLLDTGGGVRNARRHLGPDPFFVINGDAFWLNGPEPALRRLVAALRDD